MRSVIFLGHVECWIDRAVNFFSKLVSQPAWNRYFRGGTYSNGKLFDIFSRQDR